MWGLQRCFLYTTICAFPIVFSTVISLFLKQRLKELQDVEEDDVRSFTITPKNSDCWRHVMNSSSCGEECSYVHLRKMVKMIESAKIEVLLCVNHLTVNDIANALLAVKKRGVSVRCLTDCEMVKVSGSKFKYLKNNGVAVKVNKKGILHHKFVLVDERVVSFGSLNYTMQGLTKNFESVIETENPRIIRRFKDEFEFLWINENDY